jgi:CcmD family protein
MSYLFAAYAVIWTVIFGYTLMVGKRQKNLENEVLYLKSMLGKGETGK